MEGHSQWDHMDYIIRFLVFRMKVIYVLNEKNQLKGRLLKKTVKQPSFGYSLTNDYRESNRHQTACENYTNGIVWAVSNSFLPASSDLQGSTRKGFNKKKKKSVSFFIYIFIFSKEITSPASLYTLVERKGIENDDNIFFAFILWRKKNEKGMSNLSAYRFIFFNISSSYVTTKRRKKKYVSSQSDAIPS